MLHSLGPVGRMLSATIQYVGTGMQNVPDTQEQQRKLICAQCEFFKNDWCGKCGCYLPVKIKWASEHCPEGKWSGDPPVTKSSPNGGCGGCNAKQS